VRGYYELTPKGRESSFVWKQTGGGAVVGTDSPVPPHLASLFETPALESRVSFTGLVSVILTPETSMLSDLRHLLPLVIIGGSFAFSGVILYGAWLLGRYHGRDDAAPLEFAQLEARLQRVEQATMSMVDAMQRLEAANRFTTRLLTAPNADVIRTTTPH
jgi:hypothetical protein